MSLEATHYLVEMLQCEPQERRKQILNELLDYFCLHCGGEIDIDTAECDCDRKEHRVRRIETDQRE